jgi:hypothetical protein
VQSRDRMERQGNQDQAGRKTRHERQEEEKRPGPKDQAQVHEQKAAAVHMLPLRSAHFSCSLPFIFSRMLCCDTPMTLDLGSPACPRTRNQGSRMGRTPHGRRGRLASQEKPAFLGACARLHSEPYIFRLVLRRFLLMLFSNAQMDSSLSIGCWGARQAGG